MGNFEISGSNGPYSLEIIFSAKNYLVPTCDLQAGLIVLGEVLGIP
jgi:hypothetical protein